MTVIDHVGLLPAYIAAGTAILALVVDLIAPSRWVPPVVAAGLGAVGTGVAAVVAASGDPRPSFCLDGAQACSYQADSLAALIAVLFAVLTLGALALSVPALRAKVVPSGEHTFLLACSMAGGVMLGGARDLVLLVVAVEMVTIPLYALVGLRRAVRSAEAALVFFITSVVATSVALLGAGLLYAVTGTVSIERLGPALTADNRPEALAALIPVGIVLLLVGLAVKVAAVPVHGWAAPTYDGAPLPVASFLSTASKLAGVTAVVLVVSALRTRLDVVGPTLAVVSVLTMTVGNLVALKQQRMIRLLAWSSIAQGGYLLAPLGALALAGMDRDQLLTATLGYAVFFVLLEFGAFGAVVAVRGAADGGMLDDYRGLARRSWWVAAALVLALTGLAGLPPGFGGLFAKVVVIRSIVDAGGIWLAVVVALNAVIGLAYYVRVVAALFASPVKPASPAGPDQAGEPAEAVEAPVSGGGVALATRAPAKTAVAASVAPVAVAVATTVVVVSLLGLAAGFAPQVVLDAVRDAVAVLP